MKTNGTLALLFASIAFAACGGQARDGLGESNSGPGGGHAGMHGTSALDASALDASALGASAHGPSRGQGTRDAATTHMDAFTASPRTHREGGTDAGSLPPVLLERPTVWIGQISSATTYPPIAPGDSTTPQKVTLILRAVVDNQVSGTITFGNGAPPPPPTSATSPYPPDATPFQGLNWQYFPYEGFEYTLIASTAYGALLSLEYVPYELYKPLCELQKGGTTPKHATLDSSPCECTATACTSALSPRIHMDLLVSGDSMQGQYSQGAAGGGGLPESMRLRRVQ